MNRKEAEKIAKLVCGNVNEVEKQTMAEVDDGITLDRVFVGDQLKCELGPVFDGWMKINIYLQGLKEEDRRDPWFIKKLLKFEMSRKVPREYVLERLGTELSSAYRWQVRQMVNELLEDPRVERIRRY